jgi:hypothetical protein
VGVLNRKLPFIIDENAPVFNRAAPANNTTNNSIAGVRIWQSHLARALPARERSFLDGTTWPVRL